MIRSALWSNNSDQQHNRHSETLETEGMEVTEGWARIPHGREGDAGMRKRRAQEITGMYNQYAPVPGRKPHSHQAHSYILLCQDSRGTAHLILCTRWVCGLPGHTSRQVHRTCEQDCEVHGHGQPHCFLNPTAHRLASGPVIVTGFQAVGTHTSCRISSWLHWK